MRFKTTIRAKLAAMEIKYFLDDPDDDPDRFGDGYYFRIPGEEGWNGPWSGPEQCRQIYREDLEFFFNSLERRLAIYGAGPANGKKRFLLRFKGTLSPLAFDVLFMLWQLGPGRPSPMIAVVDGKTFEDVQMLLEGTVDVYGDILSEEISESIDSICERLELLHPLSAAAIPATFTLQ